MKKYIIEAGIILFIVLFMRLTILDNGFLLGFKKEVGLDVPVYVIEYESKNKSWLRGFESGMSLIQFASEYNYIVIGKYEDDWFFFDSLEYNN